MRIATRLHTVLQVVLALITAVGVVTPRPSFAQATDQILSYSELMALPPAKRTEYVRGVRQILMDLAKDPGGTMVDRSPAARSRLKAWLENLDREIAKAEAQSSTCSADPACRHAAQKCAVQYGSPVSWDRAMNAFSCDMMKSIYSPELLARKQAAKTSEEKKAIAQEMAAQQREYTSSADHPHMVSMKPGALTTGSRLGGATASIPEASVPAAPAHAPTEAAARANEPVKPAAPNIQYIDAQTIGEFIAQQGRDVSEFHCASKHRTFSPQGIENLEACDATTEARLNQEFLAQKKNFSMASVKPEAAAAAGASTTSATSVTSAPAPIVLEGNAVDAQVNSNGISRKIPYAEIEKHLKEKRNPNAICADEAKKLGTGPMSLVHIDGEMDRFCMTADAEQKYLAEQEAQAKPRSGSRGHAKLGASCEPPPDRCEALKTGRAAVFQGGLPCVFAGMISKFDGGNRKCDPVIEFSVGDQKLSCGKNQTICNPLIFGTAAGDKALCVARVQDATAQCSKSSDASGAMAFLDRKIAGVQDRWDEFRSGFNEVCKAGSIQRKFHCRECNIMRTRVFQLALKAGRNCTDSSSPFDSVKGRLRSAPSTTTR